MTRVRGRDGLKRVSALALEGCYLEVTTWRRWTRVHRECTMKGEWVNW